MNCKKQGVGYRKINNANGIAIFKTFLPKICHKLGKYLPHSL